MSLVKLFWKNSWASEAWTGKNRFWEKKISVLDCEIFCFFFWTHLSHPCLVESICKDVLPFFGPAFWTTFQHFDLWPKVGYQRHQGLGGHVEISTFLSLPVKPFKGSFRGKVVFTFSLQSWGWDSIASNGRIQIELFVHFCSCRKVLSKLDFHSFPKILTLLYIRTHKWKRWLIEKSFLSPSNEPHFQKQKTHHQGIICGTSVKSFNFSGRA